MKKVTVIIAAFVILFAALGSGASSAAAEETAYSGTLAWLNISEEAYRSYAVRLIPATVYLQRNGLLQDALDTENVKLRDWYFDTLDTMVMALECGELLCMEQPLSTANYLCAQNDSFRLRYTFPEGEPQEGFAEMVLDRMEYGYGFMMKEDDTALRDDFNRALSEMLADGTLAALQKRISTMW